MSNLPELSAAVTTTAILDEIDLDSLDAVYLGQPYCLKVEGNLLTDLEGLSKVIVRIKKAGRRAYVTTPIVPKGENFAKIEKMLAAAIEAGVDAAEVHDVGVFRWIKNNFDVPIHISSLANVYQPETAAFYRDRGVARIVPANELLATEAKIIRDAVAGVEFGAPVHGRLPLGMSYACLLRLEFPSRELTACRQQCAENHYLNMGNWRMRCVGTSLVTGDDFSLIEHLPDILMAGYDGWRLGTHFDDAKKINALAGIYRRAMKAAASAETYPSGKLLNEVRDICGELCNGWRFGLSGREYFSVRDEDPLSIIEKHLKESSSRI